MPEKTMASPQPEIECSERSFSATFADNSQIIIRGQGVMSLYDIFDNLCRQLDAWDILQEIAENAGFEVFTFPPKVAA